MTPDYWRSIREREQGTDPLVGREFPDGADQPYAVHEVDGETRREFLQLIGGTAALVGLAGCSRDPPARVLPYGKQPPEVTPGSPLHFATTLTLGGYGTGVVVTSHEGRPTKVEGNAEHPLSLGSSGIVEQGAIYHLYDPQRARTLKRRGQPSAWRNFLGAMQAKAELLAKDGGARLRFVVEPSGSPLEAELRRQLQAKFPRAAFYAYAPISADAAYQGTKLAFGRPLETQLDLDRARVIFSLDADFLSVGPARLKLARQFAAHRVPENELNRLYVAECAFSITGASADHRLRLRSSEVESLARALYAKISGEAAGGAWGDHPFVKAAAADLQSRGAQAVVVAGLRQPPAVHALAAAINAKLGSKVVSYTAPVLGDVQSSLAPLATEIAAGAVDTLVITAYNPVYTAPADLHFAELLARVPEVIYRSLFEDESARCSSWFLPGAHELESWGDARAADGTISLVQPLISPLWNGVTTSEVWAALLGTADRGAYRLLKDFWMQSAPRPDFDAWWERTLQRGVVDDSALPSLTPELAANALPPATAPESTGLELNFLPDCKIYDGRYADNAWLQELPEPLTKLTWGNALHISPTTAKKLGVESEEVVTVTAGALTLTAPILIVPGHADEALSLALGYGRSGTEMIAREIGVNGYRLRTSAALWFQPSVTLVRSGAKQKLAITQEHWAMEGRPVALEVSALDVKKKHLPLVEENRGDLPSIYPPAFKPPLTPGGSPGEGYQWAMSIDMSRCTGCSACIIACESENNILVVGKDQVRRGREMQWLRIDRYFTGPVEDPRALMQPLACVHCENAPCEYVCPVNATVHSDEGLNEMVYNRCVGTRYCSNNCPYKVRRFNFLNYHSNLQGSEELAMNPDVTVRARGVMEKCSYCVQRIEKARITTRTDRAGKREIRDGEVVTACEQACPSQAIVFGSLHNRESRVSKSHADERAYRLLHELGTRPRTVHLARVRNPNPELG